MISTPAITVYQQEIESGENSEVTVNEMKRCRNYIAQKDRRVLALYSNPRISSIPMLNLAADMTAI